MAPGEEGYLSGLSTGLAATSKAKPAATPKGKGRAKLTPQELKERRDAERAAGHHRHLRLVYDPAHPVPIREQLREQIKAKSLRVRELFATLDGDGDGVLSRADWRRGLGDFGPTVPQEVLDSAFDEADSTGAGVLEFGALDAFIHHRSQHATGGAAHAKKAPTKKPPAPTVPRAKGSQRALPKDTFTQSVR